MNILKRVGDIFLILCSSVLISIAFNKLLVPHRLLSGGVSGISVMLGYLTGIKIELFYLTLNIPLVIWGWIRLGRTFILHSILAVACTTWLMNAIPVSAFVQEPILSSVFGGVLVGTGTGLALRAGGSTGGFDIVAYIMTLNRDFPIGMFMIAVNAVIILMLGYLQHNWDLALSSMLSMFVTGKTVDLIHIRQIKVTAFIVTRFPKPMTDRLLELRRGVTLIKTEGAFSYHEQTMLMTVITRYELTLLRKIVRNCDPTAFVNIVETVGVMGEFRRV